MCIADYFPRIKSYGIIETKGRNIFRALEHFPKLPSEVSMASPTACAPPLSQVLFIPRANPIHSSHLHCWDLAPASIPPTQLAFQWPVIPPKSIF